MEPHPYAEEDFFPIDDNNLLGRIQNDRNYDVQNKAVVNNDNQLETPNLPHEINKLMIDSYVQDMQNMKIMYEVQSVSLEQKHKQLQDEIEYFKELLQLMTTEEKNLRKRRQIEENYNMQLMKKLDITEHRLASLVGVFGKLGKIVENFSVKFRDDLVRKQEKQQVFNEAVANVLRNIFEIKVQTGLLSDNSIETNPVLDKLSKLNSTLKEVVNKRKPKLENLKDKHISLMAVHNKKSIQLNEENNKLKMTKTNFEMKKKEFKNRQRNFDGKLQKILQELNAASKMLENIEVEKVNIEEQTLELVDDNKDIDSKYTELQTKKKELERENLELVAEIDGKKRQLKENDDAIKDLTDQLELAKVEFEEARTQKDKTQKLLEETQTKCFKLAEVKDKEVAIAENRQKKLEDLKLQIADGAKEKHMQEVNAELQKLEKIFDLKEKEISQGTQDFEKISQLKEQKRAEAIQMKDRKIDVLKKHYAELLATNKYLDGKSNSVIEEIRKSKDLFTAAQNEYVEKKKKMEHLQDRSETLAEEMQREKTECKIMRSRRLRRLSKSQPKPILKNVSAPSTPNKKRVTFNDKLDYKSASEETIDEVQDMKRCKKSVAK